MGLKSFANCAVRFMLDRYVIEILPEGLESICLVLFVSAPSLIDSLLSENKQMRSYKWMLVMMSHLYRFFFHGLLP